jgi:hypothetical protein
MPDFWFQCSQRLGSSHWSRDTKLHKNDSILYFSLNRPFASFWCIIALSPRPSNHANAVILIMLELQEPEKCPFVVGIDITVKPSFSSNYCHCQLFAFTTCSSKLAQCNSQIVFMYSKSLIISQTPSSSLIVVRPCSIHDKDCIVCWIQ